jgi:hypothetical protein
MKKARAIPILSGAVAVAAMTGAAALATMTAGPALAGPAQPRSGHSTIRSILRTGAIVTGVRGSGGRGVVLTGTYLSGGGSAAFLWRGPLSRAGGAAVSVLRPAFRGVTGAAFYGPDTHLFNPRAIPRGQVRAVGSYVSSGAPAGVHDQGMIYLGPVSGRGGRWTSIAVPAHGRHVTGHIRACPPRRPTCIVMDTIPHSTLGHLVVGNYDLKPTVGSRPVSGNAFIYNLSTRRYTLLRLHGSLATKSTFYGIWQDGGPGSPRFTLAGGSSARGGQRGFLINYNERTGRFGRPFFFTYFGRPVPTHFEGITAVPGGFNLVALALRHGPALAYVPVLRHGGFGRARWRRVPVSSSGLCPCRTVTGNTVWRNRVMGLYVTSATPAARTYLAVRTGR